MMDALDAIMQVMESAFDPAFGEAWNRKQAGDSLSLPHTHFLLVDINGKEPATPEDTVGFALSRIAADEEELLLIAVMPHARGRGVGTALMNNYLEKAKQRGASRIFLEMREGNPAEHLYLACGLQPVGRRSNYYRSGNSGPFDAITYRKLLD
jgi:ribosomal-protein-alanine N-acetyltransferase